MDETGPDDPETCGMKVTLNLEPGRVAAVCTEPRGHKGVHYDKVFSIGWREKVKVAA